MGGKGSGRKKTPPRSNTDPKKLSEKELLEACFGKPLSEKISKRLRVRMDTRGKPWIQEERMLERGAGEP